MTFQVHRPHPAGRCFGPMCTATAREKDRGLIPRFCSDNCHDWFVAEHTLPAPAAFIVDPPADPAAVVEIHDGEQWRPLPDVTSFELVPSTVSAPHAPAPPAAKQEATYVLTVDTSALDASLSRLATALSEVLVPTWKAIAAVLQDALRAWAPLIKQLHRSTKRTGPAPLPFDGHAYRNRTRRRTRRNR